MVPAHLKKQRSSSEKEPLAMQIAPSDHVTSLFYGIPLTALRHIDNKMYKNRYWLGIRLQDGTHFIKISTATGCERRALDLFTKTFDILTLILNKKIFNLFLIAKNSFQGIWLQ